MEVFEGKMIPRTSRDFAGFKSADPPGWIERHGVEVWRPWILAHLKGMRPCGHPLDIDRFPGGKSPYKPVIACGQVWVGTPDYLVVVSSYEVGQVGYRLYKCPYTKPTFRSEERFRTNFKLWEDKVEQSARLLKKFIKGMVHQQCFSSVEEAARAFGLDPITGIRTS